MTTQTDTPVRTDDETLARGAQRFVEHQSVRPGYCGIGITTRTQGGFYRGYSFRSGVGYGPFGTAAEADAWALAKYNEGPVYGYSR